MMGQNERIIIKSVFVSLLLLFALFMSVGYLGQF